ncbi:MAG TPA: hypothetical protein VF950_00285 [Planctomycetota bacterium]
MAIHRFLLRGGEEFRVSPRGVEVGLISHPLATLRGATARVLSRRMSLDIPGGPLRLEFTDRKTREAAMEALAKLLGGRVTRTGKTPWSKIEVGQKT